MRPEDFRFRLVAASFQTTLFASPMVQDILPFAFRYSVVLNQSCDDGREADETVYPGDDHQIHDDLSADNVIQLLCRDSKVPQWIDISVVFCSDAHTHLSLLCCGRYHSDEHRLYYFDKGTQPFGIKSPSLPAGFISGDRIRLPDRETYLSNRRSRSIIQASALP